MARTARRTAAVSMALAGALVLPGIAEALPPNVGASTVTNPYVLPVAAGVDTTSIFTVSDAKAADNGYEMTGIPDGLGALKQGDNVVVFMNHELGQTSGTVRRHGEAGSFVSRLVLNPGTLRVKSGKDWINPGVRYWDYPSGTFASEPNAFVEGSVADLAAFARFCSGDLTSAGQLLNPSTGAGFAGPLYFANEEAGPESRVFGVRQNGDAWQLPRLGLFSWENTLAAFNTTDETVVMGNEDQSGPTPSDNLSQLWVYSGRKQSTGTPVAKAGLTNGSNFVVQVGDGPLNDAGTRALIAGDADGKVRFDLEEVDWNQSGADQNAEALATGMSLNRVEDGEFDPFDKNVYYFVTTEGSAEAGAVPPRDGGGLWRLTFDNVERPERGGTLELLLDGTEPVYSAVGGETSLNKPDNMTIDQHGNLLIQEDPGNNAHLARIVAYRLSDGALGVVARFDAALFSGATPLTLDEESSGIIETQSLLGTGTFLFDAQVHTASGLDDPATQVERGQLLKLRVANWTNVYGSAPPV